MSKVVIGDRNMLLLSYLSISNKLALQCKFLLARMIYLLYYIYALSVPQFILLQYRIWVMKLVYTNMRFESLLSRNYQPS